MRRTPIESDSGGTQIETVTRTRGRQNRTVERRTPIATGGSETNVETESTGGGGGRQVSGFSPPKAGNRVASIGLLEAEFLGALMLQVLLLFADTNKSYSDKIMSTMKRGTMISLLFFVLALIAGTGPNVARVSKAIGGLTVVAIFLTSPMTDVIGNMDKFFKADWANSGEHGTDIGGQTDSSGNLVPSNSPAAAGSNAIQRITQIIESFGFGIIK